MIRVEEKEGGVNLPLDVTLADLCKEMRYAVCEGMRYRISDWHRTSSLNVSLPNLLII